METGGLVIRIVLGILVAYFVYKYAKDWRETVPKPGDVLGDLKPMYSERLRGHTGEFKQSVVKVTDGVYVAIGYALANSILIEAPEGAIVVDVTESLESARMVYDAFRKVTKSPIKALIYTHNHADHIYGGEAFLEDPKHPPEVWAHYTIIDLMRRNFERVSRITFIRAMRQFGVFLPDHVNSGIGLKLNYDDTKTIGIVMPNKFLYGEEKTVKIAGLEVKLLHIPGETEDQMAVWIPEKRVLCPADDLYRAFPNLYAIRGTPTRDLLHWVNSLDKMRHLRPEYLVPAHTRPVYGEQNIFDLLTLYRDAIQFVHDQTVRFLNKGFLPDEIVEKVQLPARVADHPFLLEFYGTVGWSVKGVVNSYMGWFSGDPVDLLPLTPKARAERIVRLAGGVDSALTAAQKALDEEDNQWALALSADVFRLYPENRKAMDIKIQAMKRLAEVQTSSNGRNYYLTYALEDAGALTIHPRKDSRESIIRKAPLGYLFEAMKAKLKAEEAAEVNASLAFIFTDINKNFTLHIRNSILDVVQGESEEWTHRVTTTSAVWRDILADKRSALAVIATGELSVEGGVLGFRNIMDLFEKDKD